MWSIFLKINLNSDHVIPFHGKQCYAKYWEYITGIKEKKLAAESKRKGDLTKSIYCISL